MKIHNFFLFFIFLRFLLLPAFLHAQFTADEIETLLDTRAITYGQAVRFALEASGTLAVSDQREAFQYVMDQKWLPKNISVNNEVRLDVISMLLMRSFNISGGIFYFIFKNPHYAYRELVYRDVIQGRADPAMKVSGELFLLMTGRILSQRGDALVIVESPRPVEEEAVVEEPPHEETDDVREALADEINEYIDEHNIADTNAEAIDEGIMIRIFNIHFESDSTELAAPEIKKIVEIANILRKYRGSKIQVSGHAAAAGSLQGQQIVSQERARVIALYLVMLGACRAEDITAVGFGAEQPIASNDTAEGRIQNRRVEITILDN